MEVNNNLSKKSNSNHPPCSFSISLLFYCTASIPKILKAIKRTKRLGAKLLNENLLNFSPSNVLELLFECFVEPSVEDRIWEGRRHSDQMTKRETNSTHLLVLKRHFANLFMLLFLILDFCKLLLYVVNLCQTLPVKMSTTKINLFLGFHTKKTICFKAQTEKATYLSAKKIEKSKRKHSFFFLTFWTNRLQTWI